MGLGSFPDVSLSIAREKARAARSDTTMGIDPVAHRKEARSARQVLKATQKTFADCAKAYIEAHSDSWRNAKHRAQWPSTFETYVYPTMGTVMVGEVTQAHVMAVLLPIWKTLPQDETRVYRLQTDDGQRIIGRRVSPAWVATTLATGAAPSLTPVEVHTLLLEGKTGGKLA